jgi:2-haloacid dehalogenase
MQKIIMQLQTQKYKNIIFDLGGVLIDWNPRYMYKKVFQNAAEMEYFLAHICTDAWNIQQDCGNTLAIGTAKLCAQFPEYATLIKLYYARWTEMLGGEIAQTVDLLKQLQKNNYNLYALTNWSHETFPYARKTFSFLNDFIDIVVSGEEKVLKPDHEIYNILLKRNQLQASECVFIDDNLVNVKAAEELGIAGVHFVSPEDCMSKLKSLGVKIL